MIKWLQRIKSDPLQLVPPKKIQTPQKFDSSYQEQLKILGLLP